MSGSSMTRRKTQDAKDALPPHVVARHEEWGHFKAGDRCFIDGDQSGRYTFRYADEYDNGVVAAVVIDDRNLWFTPGIDRLLPASGPSRSSQEDGSEAKLEPTAGDIRGRREALKWSRGELARRSGVGIPAIASLEAGKQPRDGSARAKVLAALDAAGGASPEPASLPEGPGVFDQVVTEKFGGVHPDELEALGADPFDEEDD